MPRRSVWVRLPRSIPDASVGFHLPGTGSDSYLGPAASVACALRTTAYDAANARTDAFAFDLSGPLAARWLAFLRIVTGW